MKYLKTFEGRFDSTRNKMKYLTIDDTNNLIDFVLEYISSLNILDKIDELSLDEIEHENFQYRTIYNNLIGQNSSNIRKNNFYTIMDDYNIKNKLNFETPAFRNSLFKIEDQIYKNFKKEFKDKLDKKLIVLLEADPINFKDNYKSYENELNSDVKNATKWMLQANKFNI